MRTRTRPTTSDDGRARGRRKRARTNRAAGDLDAASSHRFLAPQTCTVSRPARPLGTWPARPSVTALHSTPADTAAAPRSASALVRHHVSLRHLHRADACWVRAGRNSLRAPSARAPACPQLAAHRRRAKGQGCAPPTPGMPNTPPPSYGCLNRSTQRAARYVHPRGPRIFPGILCAPSAGRARLATPPFGRPQAPPYCDRMALSPRLNASRRICDARDMDRIQ
jgi:hypothetical protein